MPKNPFCDVQSRKIGILKELFWLFEMRQLVTSDLFVARNEDSIVRPLLSFMGK